MNFPCEKKEIQRMCRERKKELHFDDQNDKRKKNKLAKLELVTSI